MIETAAFVLLEVLGALDDLAIDKTFGVDFDLLGGETFCDIVQSLSHLSQVLRALELLTMYLVRLSLCLCYSLTNVS